MSSTIQVDNIKDIGGNTIISSDGSGTFTSNLSSNVSSATGTLPIANGGTGATTLAAAGLTNTPRFLVTMSGNQTGLSDAAITKASFNTEVFDSDSAYDTSNYKFTVPAGKAGVYYIYAKIDSSADAASQVRSMRTYIYLNGSEYSPSVSEQDPRDNYTLGGAFMAGTLMNLSVADYVEAYSRIDTQGGGTWNISSTFSVFGGYKLI